MTVERVNKAIFELETDEGVMYLICDGDQNLQPEITLVDDWVTRYLEIKIPHQSVLLARDRPETMSVVDCLTDDMYEEFYNLII